MKRFSCPTCAGAVFFDSSGCVTCGADIGYSLPDDELLLVTGTRPRCSNAALAGCTWLTTTPSQLCESCELTRTRPADQDAEGLDLFPVAEQSKRHLMRDLTRLGLTPKSKANDESGLGFDLLSSVAENVTIGHADGIITIDLAEGDHSHRERMRQQLDEPYRTMLGHLRHESGHYFEWLLVENTDRIHEARRLFGDERASYQDAIDRHYAEGAPEGWAEDHISQYATMHPYEDFAETWAHYLHIQDTLETAAAFDLTPPPDHSQSFRDRILQVWLPFATAMNVVNRSLGQRDLYPFVLPNPVIDKLAFIDSCCGRSRVADTERSTEGSMNRPDFRSYREPCPAGAGWPDSRSA